MPKIYIPQQNFQIFSKTKKAVPPLLSAFKTIHAKIAASGLSFVNKKSVLTSKYTYNQGQRDLVYQLKSLHNSRNARSDLNTGNKELTDIAENKRRYWHNTNTGIPTQLYNLYGKHNNNYKNRMEMIKRKKTNVKTGNITEEVKAEEVSGQQRFTNNVYRLVHPKPQKLLNNILQNKNITRSELANKNTTN
jgi:hypothetical protein